MNDASRNYLLLLVAAGICFFCGCQYHLGNPLASTYDSIAVGDISNTSTAAELTVLMKNAVSDQLLQEPGLAVTDADQADLVLDMHIRSFETGTAGRTRNRDKRLTSRHQSSYITVLYRLTLSVDYTLSRREAPETPVLKGTVEGESFMPLTHDHAMALAPALRAAAVNAAERITSAIFTIGD